MGDPYNTNLAAEFHVLSMLHRRGAEASLKPDPNFLDTVFATTTMTAAKEVGHGRQAAEVHVSWQ